MQWGIFHLQDPRSCTQSLCTSDVYVCSIQKGAINKWRLAEWNMDMMLLFHTFILCFSQMCKTACLCFLNGSCCYNKHCSDVNESSSNSLGVNSLLDLGLDQFFFLKCLPYSWKHAIKEQKKSEYVVETLTCCFELILFPLFTDVYLCFALCW